MINQMQEVHWARKIGRGLYELTEGHPEKIKRAWEILLNLPEGDRIYAQVDFLSAMGERASNFEELGEVVAIAATYNLIKVVNLKPEEVPQKKPFWWQKKSYLPTDPNDKRLIALLSNLKRASARIKTSLGFRQPQEEAPEENSEA